MTEAKSVPAIDAVDGYPKQISWYLPGKTLVYEHHTPRAGGKYPAPFNEVPEGGITIATGSQPTVIPRGKTIEHWYRILRFGPEQYAGRVEQRWVCLERKKGEQGGHWRGANVSNRSGI